MTFNEAVCDLIKHLRLTYQAPDGTIYWYEGTIQLMFKVLGFLYEDSKGEAERPNPHTNELKKEVEE